MHRRRVAITSRHGTKGISSDGKEVEPVFVQVLYLADRKDMAGTSLMQGGGTAVELVRVEFVPPMSSLGAENILFLALKSASRHDGRAK